MICSHLAVLDFTSSHKQLGKESAQMCMYPTDSKVTDPSCSLCSHAFEKVFNNLMTSLVNFSFVQNRSQPLWLLWARVNCRINYTSLNNFE